MASQTNRPSILLRVAAAWGTTVLSVRHLLPGESIVMGDGPSATMVMPDGLIAAEVPLRAVGGSWEMDARGVTNGIVQLRGREEDPTRLATGALPLLPGDWGLLQYGSFSLFFQFTEPPPPLVQKLKREWLLGFAFASSMLMHVLLFSMVRSLTTPPPIPKPAELSNAEEIAARFGLKHVLTEEPPAPAETGARTAASGVKNPGASDTKKQGGGKKMADTEGKLGKNGKEDRTELPGEVRNGLGGVTDVLASDTGEEIRHTLNTISTVAAALGGLNSQNIVLGTGSGTGLKGIGAGGGGIGAGVPFGSGTLNTGFGFGNGGGLGLGNGGPGGAGRGGNGRGGTGQGAGTAERQVAVSSGAGTGSGGLSPEQIRRVVMAHLGALRACYESEADRNPNLRGGLTVQWQIAPEGVVSGASLANSSLGNARVEGCVIRQVRGWKFPSSPSVSSVSWPFKFGLAGGS
jgi:hypothetical protein